jgi:hypothetical protein
VAEVLDRMAVLHGEAKNDLERKVVDDVAARVEAKAKRARQVASRRARAQGQAGDEAA